MIESEFNIGDHIEVIEPGSFYHGSWGRVVEPSSFGRVVVRLDGGGIGELCFLPAALKNYGPSKVEAELDKQDEEDGA